MEKGSIIIQRYLYEEPHHINLVLNATNGSYSGLLNYYCNAIDLKEIGEALKNFPKKIPDEYKYQLGSTRVEDRWAHFLSFRVYTVDLVGHSAIQISINNNAKTPEEGICTFSIKTDPAAINKLGELLVAFGKLEHLELQWMSSGEGFLKEKYSQKL